VKLNKIVILGVPLLAGVLFAKIVLFPLDPPGKSSPLATVRKNQKDNRIETAGSKDIPQSISQYLVSSQALFSKAISLSQKEKTGMEEQSKNAQIVQLVNEAINQATQAAIHYPFDPRGYAQRAKIYQGIEKYLPQAQQTALGDWERAASLSSGDPQYFKSAGQLALKMKQPEKALSYWRQAAQIAPTDAQLIFDLAQLESKLGFLAQAQLDYRQIKPLLVSEEQKQLVDKELTAIRALLAQNKQGPGSETKAKTDQVFDEKDLSLPDHPPQLEADSGADFVIIAADQDSKDSVQENVADSNALSGTAILPGGQVEIKIDNRNLTTQSQVYLAAIGKTDNQVLRVKSKKACPTTTEEEACGYFKVSLNQALNHDLEFKWWIIK